MNGTGMCRNPTRSLKSAMVVPDGSPRLSTLLGGTDRSQTLSPWNPVQGQAAQIVGVHRQTVNIWLKRYRQQGEDGVLDGRRVSPRRGKGALSAEETGQVRA